MASPVSRADLNHLLCLQAGLSPSVSPPSVPQPLATLGAGVFTWYLSDFLVAAGELEQIMRAVALILSRLAENPNYSKFTSNSVSVGGGLALSSQRDPAREPGVDAPAPALNGGAMLIPGLQVGPLVCSRMLFPAECGSVSRRGALCTLAQPNSSMMFQS